MMKKSSDISHIETVVRNFKGLMLLAIIGLAIWAAYASSLANSDDWYDKHNGEGMFIVAIACIGACIFYGVACHLLFLNPLRAHGEWVVNNRIFASKPKNLPNNNELDIKIIGGEKLKSFSVADELLKMAELKEKGHIREDEFMEARKKLLQKT